MPTNPNGAQKPDLVALAHQARALIHANLTAGAPAARVKTLVHSRLPAAWAQLPHAALIALARRPPDGGCRWDSAMINALAEGQPEIRDTPATRALLGPPCQGCRRRWALARAKVQAELEQRPFAAAIAASTRSGSPTWMKEAVTAAAAEGCACTLRAQLEHDCLRMGAIRAATKWGLPSGFWTGNPVAIRRAREHPVLGPLLRQPAHPHGLHASGGLMVRARIGRRRLTRVPLPATHATPGTPGGTR
jgi:hypothetical protein